MTPCLVGIHISVHVVLGSHVLVFQTLYREIGIQIWIYRSFDAR